MSVVCKELLHVGAQCQALAGGNPSLMAAMVAAISAMHYADDRLLSEARQSYLSNETSAATISYLRTHSECTIKGLTPLAPCGYTTSLMQSIMTCQLAVPQTHHAPRLQVVGTAIRACHSVRAHY